MFFDLFNLFNRGESKETHSYCFTLSACAFTCSDSKSRTEQIMYGFMRDK